MTKGEQVRPTAWRRDFCGVDSQILLARTGSFMLIGIPDEEAEKFLRAGYIAYVPVGAVKKGEALAKTLQCSLCHGANLEGLGPVPSLAGRSPSYMARQLFDFQTGARHGLWSDLMKPIVAKMTAEDLVNITAYIASKNPPAAGIQQTARAN